MDLDSLNKELIFTFGPSGCKFVPAARITLTYNILGVVNPVLYYIKPNGQYVRQTPDYIDIKQQLAAPQRTDCRRLRSARTARTKHSNSIKFLYREEILRQRFIIINTRDFQRGAKFEQSNLACTTLPGMPKHAAN